jgi:hypothetical protein
MASDLAWGRGARLGRLWILGFGIIAEDYDDDGKLGLQSVAATAAMVGGTFFVLTPSWSTTMYGRAIKGAGRYLAAPLGRGAIAVVTNPYVMAAAVPIAVGGIISYAIDPEKGLNRYGGFITGGMVGQDEPNYWDTDANDSGFFNIPKNFETVAESQPLTRALTWTISETNKKVDAWSEILGL